MLNKKVIAGIATASIVVSCGFVGSFAFADEVPANNPVTTPAGYHDEVPNNPPKPNPVTTPTVKPEDDIYGSGSEWDQLQNAENEYENYYDQKYNTHNNYNGGHGTINFDPNWFNTDPNGNDTKPEIPDEHKNPQTPPAPQPKVDTTKEDAEFKSAQDSANQKAKNALLLKQIAEGSVKALQLRLIRLLVLKRRSFKNSWKTLKRLPTLSTS